MVGVGYSSYFQVFWESLYFLRRLYVWGGILLALWIAYLIAPSLLGTEEEELGLMILFNLIFLGLSIWLGIKGNEMTAKNYLEQGWKFTEPNSEEVKFAKGKWGITI